MQTIDAELQRTVWARVLGHAPAQSRTEAEPEAAEFLRFLEDEHQCAVECRRLSRRLWGRDAALLRGIAEETMMHVHILRAACYAGTGRRTEVQAAETPRIPSVPEALLHARNHAQEMAEGYEKAAKRWDALAGEFQAMAEEKRRHAQLLHLLLGRKL